MKNVIAIAISLVLSAGVASAADSEKKSFEGFFGGVAFSHNHIDAKNSMSWFPHNPIDFSGEASSTAIRAGYNWRVGQVWVLGFEGSYSPGGITTETDFSFSNGFNAHGDVSISNQINLVAKVGAVVKENLMIYGVFGGTHGRFSNQGSYKIETENFVTYGGGEDSFAPTVGIGAELSIGNGWTVDGRISATRWGAKPSAEAFDYWSIETGPDSSVINTSFALAVHKYF